MAQDKINPLTFYDGAPFSASDLNILQENINVASLAALKNSTTVDGIKQYGVVRTGIVTMPALKANVPGKKALTYGNFDGGIPYVVASPFLSEPLGSSHQLTVTVVGVELGSSPFIYVTSNKDMPAGLVIAWIAARMSDAT